MRIRILGSAAGGRFPQWNCGCGNCVAVRAGTFSGKARTQAQLALSADGSSWFLAGASPDLAFQIESSPALHPRALRDSPIAGVVLGSADLDHVVGLLLLRELQPLRVYASSSILRILREENSMFGMLNRVEPQVVWTVMHSGVAFPLLAADGRDSGLRCEVHYLSGRYPKYVKTKTANLGHEEATAALFFESAGRRVAYVPAVGSLSDSLLAKIDRTDLLLFDGTFWSDDELRRVQGSGETAHQMGHIPVEESLRLLKNIKVGRKMFIHLNNTNPILNEASPEHQAVRQAGWEVAEDNWQVEL
ncbi:MAG: pyrroloquinoline quinone biosynthesis protein PqqB [Acidobacteriia bacterium]|nr:pyrroloquinoline quinone biosynthesis protein PqqB [Terriglobia bacterium]